MARHVESVVSVVDPAAGTARLYARGEFDRDNCDLICAAVDEMLGDGLSDITVDLRGVTFVDAATVTTMLACRNRAIAAGGTLRLAHGAGIVALVLDVCGVPQDAQPAVTRGRAARPRLKRDLTAVSAEITATSIVLIERAESLLAQTRRIIATIHR